MNKQNRTRRDVLWRKNPKCRKCGKLTELPVHGQDCKHNTATFQHAHSKNHPQRGIGKNKNTIWCHECNSKDGQKWGLELLKQNLHNFSMDELLEEFTFDNNRILNGEILHEDRIEKCRLIKEEVFKRTSIIR